MKNISVKHGLAGLCITPLALACSQAFAQVENNDDGPITDYQSPLMMEETIVFGRLKNAAEDVALERMEHETVSDVIGIAQIGRIGDSTVASALRRVPGVTLVDGKYVYVRGLGERYSSATLNGASVPSPDLTRSVIPLDIFPTSILQSISVQKGYTADMPATFGGGNIDIRTRGVPDSLVASFEVGTGFNSEQSSGGYTFDGGMDGMGDAEQSGIPNPLSNALSIYRGDITSSNIRRLTNDLGGDISRAQAEAINRDLAISLNNNASLKNKDLPADVSFKANVGNSFLFDNSMEVGFLLGGSFNETWRQNTITERAVGRPDVLFRNTDETRHAIDLTANAVGGLRLDDDNEVNASYIFIRNSDEEAVESQVFNSNSNLVDNNSGVLQTEARFEKRELEVYQLTGSHRLTEDFRGNFGLGGLTFLDDLEFDWYTSQSTATTDIPRAYVVQRSSFHDENSGARIGSALRLTAGTIEHTFIDLEDEVDSSGYHFSMPFNLGGFDLTLDFGQEFVSKGRTYRETDFQLGSTDSNFAPFQNDTTSSALSDQNVLNPAFDFEVRRQTNARTGYLAATTTQATFGQADLFWDEQFRLVLGLRAEEYQQIGLPWDPYEFEGSQIPDTAEEIEDLSFNQDEIYPSISGTWMQQQFLGAEDWQLRFSYSETVVRPDLREITANSYRDPITDINVSGDPDITPTDITNYDLRAEWFYDDGDTMTVSLFYKDLDQPIELRETPAGDDRIAARLFNAESGTIYGVEFEWLQGLDLISESLSAFFLQGNVTLSDTEIEVDEPDLTNQSRPLNGASDWVVNLQLGFDSDDGLHAATLVYNVFGERVFLAGRNGIEDSYEQPFNSLDLTYSWYPFSNMTVKAKVNNILDDKRTIEQQGVVTYEEMIGTSFSTSIQFQY